MNDNEQAPLLQTEVHHQESTEAESSQTTSNNVVIRKYKMRFWILLLFSFIAFFQCMEWNTWGPISASVQTAYGWQPSTVAMMSNWGTIMFVFFVMPMCYVMQVKGLRTGVMLCAALVSFGTALRCIMRDSPYFTVLCHLCAISVGIAGTLAMAAPPFIAAQWFPSNERTTATAVAQLFNQLGNAGSYLQPYIVSAPSKHPSDEEITQMKSNIQTLMLISASIAITLFGLVWWYYPSKPAHPPSLSATQHRIEFYPALKSLSRNRATLMVVFSYSLTAGVPSAWISVFNYSFLAFNIQQDEAILIAILSIACSCVASFTVGRFTDRFYGHLKWSLIGLAMSACACFYWFLLLSTKSIPAQKWQVYVSVILGITLNYATVPLFFELAVELSYPCNEIVVGGFVTAGNNLVGIVFLGIFFAPYQSYAWMTYCLVIASAVAILPLLFVRETHYRSFIDGRGRQ